MPSGQTCGYGVRMSPLHRWVQSNQAHELGLIMCASITLCNVI